MIFRTNLSSQEEKAVYDSKKERYGEGEKAITPGYELSTLINAIDESQAEALKEAVEIIKTTSSDTVRTPIGWRVSAKTNEKLEELAAQVNATKSDVVRGIIHMRAKELKGKNEDAGFSAAAWVINNGAVLPVRLIINEVMRIKSDFFVLSDYDRTALGRCDLKSFFSEQGYAIYESRNVADERGFLVLYNKRFDLIAQVTGAREAFLPLLFRDKNTHREIVLVAVKVPSKANVNETLKTLDDLITDLQQARIKSAEIVAAGDFRSIPSYIENNKLFQSLTVCPSQKGVWSFVYEKTWRNTLDHIFISNGLEYVGKAEYKTDFLADENYNGATAEDYIDRDLHLPNHAVVYSKIKYK